MGEQAVRAVDTHPARDDPELPPLPLEPEPTKKRTLLPAFEPLSSSPASFQRCMKRRYDGSPAREPHYPTPVPTSSTGLLLSSPRGRDTARPQLRREVSALSERMPLGTVPIVHLLYDGTPVLMGRSSNSSNYQLAANRLISRVHVRASYRSATSSSVYGDILIECLGWNGAKVHCGGRRHDLAKGDMFASNKPRAEIIVDVQDTRVLLGWPAEAIGGAAAFPRSPSAYSDQGSPTRAIPSSPSHRLASSPPPFPRRFESPVSPSPAGPPDLEATFILSDLSKETTASQIQVYEDHDSDAKQQADSPEPRSPSPTPKPLASEVFTAHDASQSSGLSATSGFSDEGNENEENDPVVHSFGPFGANLLENLESFQTKSPTSKPSAPAARTGRRQAGRKPSASPRTRHVPNEESSKRTEFLPVANHAVNQLAFSRVHSVPISTIFHNLPTALKSGDPDQTSLHPLTQVDLKKILDDTVCVGGISREGKDAAGKPLEDEYYYVPECDVDVERRTAVEGMGKPGLRNVRKQHKQYFWKRPRY